MKDRNVSNTIMYFLNNTAVIDALREFEEIHYNPLNITYKYICEEHHKKFQFLRKIFFKKRQLLKKQFVYEFGF